MPYVFQLFFDSRIQRPSGAAAHSNDSGRYLKFAPQNRPSFLNHVLMERAAGARS